MQFVINTVLSALIIAGTVELSKRSDLWAALLVSLPLISIVAPSFLYIKSGDTSKVVDMSYGIFWLVLPSLSLFLILPALLKYGVNFWPSLALSCISLAMIYGGCSLVLKKFVF